MWHFIVGMLRPPSTQELAPSAFSNIVLYIVGSRASVKVDGYRVQPFLSPLLLVDAAIDVSVTSGLDIHCVHVILYPF